MAGKKKTEASAPERITRRWLDGLLDRKLHGMLSTTGQNPAHLVAEFVRLVQLDRGSNPPKRTQPEVVWIGWGEREPDTPQV